jgi:hypothetical protein
MKRSLCMAGVLAVTPLSASRADIIPIGRTSHIIAQGSFPNQPLQTQEDTFTAFGRYSHSVNAPNASSFQVSTTNALSVTCDSDAAGHGGGGTGTGDARSTFNFSFQLAFAHTFTLSGSTDGSQYFPPVTLQRTDMPSTIFSNTSRGAINAGGTLAAGTYLFHTDASGGLGTEETLSVVLSLVPCAADINADGRVSVADFLAFLQLYSTGDPQADFSGDGQVNITDFLAFLAAYAAGCS